MAEKSAIEWLRDPFLDRAGATWNRWYGCERQSAACANCYIPRQPPLRMNKLKFDKVSIGGRTDIVMANETVLLKPLRWKQPVLIFPNSLSDIWDGRVNIARVAEMFAVMLLTPRHIYITTTKRHRRQRNWLSSPRFVPLVAEAVARVMLLAQENGVRIPKSDIEYAWAHLLRSGGEPRHPLKPLANHWVGVTLESNETAERARYLHETPGAVKWLSCEPITGDLDFDQALSWPCAHCDGEGVMGESNGREIYCDAEGCANGQINFCPDWVVFGGESGPAAKATDLDTEPAPGLRPLDLDQLDTLIWWARNMLIPVFVKQLGDPWAAEVRAAAKAGRDPAEWPEHLRIRRYPDQLAYRALQYDPDNQLARKELALV